MGTQLISDTSYLLTDQINDHLFDDKVLVSEVLTSTFTICSMIEDTPLHGYVQQFNLLATAALCSHEQRFNNSEEAVFGQGKFKKKETKSESNPFSIRKVSTKKTDSKYRFFCGL